MSLMHGHAPATQSGSGNPAEVSNDGGRESHWRRTVIGLALSAISAALLWLSWPHLGNWWLVVFFAFVPMLVAQYRLMPQRLSGLPLGIAAGAYWSGGLWMGSGPVGPWALLIPAVVIGLLWWGLGAFDKRFAERTGYRWFLVQLPLVWVAVDVLIQGNLVSAAMPWLAYRLWQLPALIQTVSVVGSPALTFLLLMINTVLAMVMIRWCDRRWPDAVCPGAR